MNLMGLIARSPSEAALPILKQEIILGFSSTCSNTSSTPASWTISFFSGRPQITRFEQRSFSSLACFSGAFIFPSVSQHRRPGIEIAFDCRLHRSHTTLFFLNELSFQFNHSTLISNLFVLKLVHFILESGCGNQKGCVMSSMNVD